MATLTGKDIFSAVYVYVRESYVANWFSTKVQTTTDNKSVDEDENLNLSKFDATATTKEENKIKTVSSGTKTLREKIERMEESEIADKIRMEIDEKMPYALAAVCSNLSTLDREYRAFKGYDEQPDFSEFIFEKSDSFPLCERFVFPAVMYVSSMVLIDIDEKKSDDYYDKYATTLSQIIAEMPYQTTKTVEKYPY